MNKTMIFEYIQKNKLVIIYLFCFVFGLSLYANTAYFVSDKKLMRFFPPFVEGVNKKENMHLGAEYYNIAVALASGKGFSNPFLVETGPTAWMPPLYPFFLAGLILIFKSKIAVSICIIFLQNLTLIGSGLMTHEVAKKTFLNCKAEIAVFIYSIYLLFDFRWFFQFTHDSWLFLLLVSTIFLFSVFLLTQQHHITAKMTLWWGVVGGISFLTSPILGLVWLLLSAQIIIVTKKSKHIMFSLLLCTLLFSPWVARNYIIFDKLILMKSNLYFDLYYATYETKNGLIDELMFVKSHPCWNIQKDPDSIFRKCGENAFLAQYKEKFDEAFTKDPYKYFNSVMTRFLAAFVVYYPHGEHEQSGLMQNFIHILPFLSFILMIVKKAYLRSRHIIVSMSIYVIYLLPYIAINYYIRYALPLTPLKVLLVFWAIDLIVNRVKKHNPKKV